MNLSIRGSLRTGAANASTTWRATSLAMLASMCLVAPTDDTGAAPIIVSGGNFTGASGSNGSGGSQGAEGLPDFFAQFNLGLSTGLDPGQKGLSGGAGGPGGNGLSGAFGLPGHYVGGGDWIINGGSFAGGHGGDGGQGGRGGFAGTGEPVTHNTQPQPGDVVFGGNGGDGGWGGAGGAGGIGGAGLLVAGIDIRLAINGGLFAGGLGGNGGAGGRGGDGGEGGWGRLWYQNRPPNYFDPNLVFDPTPADAQRVGGRGGDGGTGGPGGHGGAGGSGILASGSSVRIDIFGGQFFGAMGGAGGHGGDGGLGGGSPIDRALSAALTLCPPGQQMLPVLVDGQLTFADCYAPDPEAQRTTGGEGADGGIGGSGGLAGFGEPGTSGELGALGALGNYGAGFGGKGGNSDDGGFGGFGGFGLVADDGAQIFIHGTGTFDRLTGELDAVLVGGGIIDSTALEFRGGRIVFVTEPGGGNGGNGGGTAIPEPGTVTLIAITGALFAVIRRRTRCPASAFAYV
jgi:hypothetical protein